MSRVRAATGSKLQTTGQATRVRTEPAQAAPFSQELRAARLGSVRSRLDQMLGNIDALGARLAEERNLGNLKAYKAAVREFLSMVQREAVQVHSESDWDFRSWEQRQFTIARLVDEELDSLAHMVLDHEQDRLQLLAKIGEIKGMLLDIRI